MKKIIMIVVVIAVLLVGTVAFAEGKNQEDGQGRGRNQSFAGDGQEAHEKDSTDTPAKGKNADNECDGTCDDFIDGEEHAYGQNDNDEQHAYGQNGDVERGNRGNQTSIDCDNEDHEDGEGQRLGKGNQNQSTEGTSSGNRNGRNNK